MLINSHPQVVQPAPAILFYDGRCPLCATEIRWLNRFKRDGLQLIDIHRMVNTSGVEREKLLRRLHILRSDGSWVTGMDASVAAWSYTPFGFLLRPLRWRLFSRIVDQFYEYWAEKRYCHRYRCSVNSARDQSTADK